MTQIPTSKKGINWKPGLGQSFLRHLLRDLQLGSSKARNVLLSHVWLPMHLGGELGMQNQASLKNTEVSYVSKENSKYWSPGLW